MILNDVATTHLDNLSTATTIAKEQTTKTTHKSNENKTDELRRRTRDLSVVYSVSLTISYELDTMGNGRAKPCRLL